MIIETAANEFFQVQETGNPDLAHVWMGVPVKRAKGGVWVQKANAKKQLVRKEASKVVEA